MSVTSFAKIDMSLDDIIKLNKKEKKLARNVKNLGKSKTLVAAKQKRAEILKAKARNMKMAKVKGQKVTRGKRAPAFKTSNIKRRNKPGLTRGGKENAGRNKQFQKQTMTKPQQARRAITGPKARGGRITVQDRLGEQINNAQSNRRQKRQQIMNRNRRGLSTARGRGNSGRNARSQNTNQASGFRRNNTQQSRKRQYNNQPRKPLGPRQSGRGRGVQNRRQQQAQRQAGYFGNTQRQRVNNNRGRGSGRQRGAVKTQRKVTLY